MIFRKAVLIIHGFAGGTYDEEPLFFKLQNYLEFDVYNFTLPGHSINLSSDVKYEDWINSVDDKINTLLKLGYKKIYLVGHSMGGVLATHAAIKYPQVDKVVLVAPAFNYLSMTEESDVVKVLKSATDVIKTYQAKEVVSRLLKVSVNQLKEFQELVKVSKNNPSLLTQKTLIIHGTKDQLVPFESSNKIFNEMKCPKWIIKVSDVTHDVFYGDKVEEICNEIIKFLKSNNYSAKNEREW